MAVMIPDDVNQFILSMDGHPEKLENPLKQAKTYSHFLMDKIN
jgi:hypothetical protein